jgi:transcriptional regulator with XRE-family HTH domain
MTRVRQSVEFECREFPKLLKRYRFASSKSAQQLATECGISLAQWYKLEKGVVPVISLELFRSIETAIGLTFELTDPSNLNPHSKGEDE